MEHAPASFIQAKSLDNQLYKIKLKNFMNTQYVGEISVAEPGNSFNVVYDTGSPNIWLNSIRCEEDICKQYKQYDWTKSKTFEELGVDIQITFGSGTLDGVMNKDTVYFNGLEIPDQTINEIIYDDGSILSGAQFEGIVGLAFEAIAEPGDIPILDNILDQHILKHDVMSFYYGVDPKVQDSVMTLGGIDESLAASPIKYYDIDGRDFWSLTAETVLVDGEDLNLCPEGCKLLFDTGTSLITVPTENMEKIVPHLDVENNCNNISSLPTFTFVIQGDNYILTPEQYVMSTTSEGENIPQWHHDDPNQVLECESVFTALDLAGPFGPGWILGDIFLSRYYTIYDRDNDRIGIADAKKHKIVSEKYTYNDE